MSQKRDDVAAPFEMKEQDKAPTKLIPTTKAYMDQDFLASKNARIVRILCEFEQPAQRLNRCGVKGTVLFFGSARAMFRPDWTRTFNDLQTQAQTNSKLQEKVEAFKKTEWMCEWCDKAQELARLLTQWALTDVKLQEHFAQLPDYFDHEDSRRASVIGAQSLVVTTGGGPGLMEAANRGAASVPGAVTMGMGISLPFEKGLNPYVTPDMAFEFHYFFTRKFWMMYSARALVIAPGGFGTMDELFELMTLKQTGKIPDLPIVLLSSRYWKTVINWQAFADFGTVSQKEIDALFFADTAEDAFEFIKTSILKNARARHPAMSPSLGCRPSPSHGTTLPPPLTL